MKTKFTLVMAFVSFVLFAGAQSYCTFSSPAYSPNQPGITNFKMAGVDRPSANVEGSVIVSTGLTVTLTIGQTYSFSITHSEDQVSGPPLTGARNNIRIWIDYNSDFIFANSGVEVAVLANSLTPNSTYTNSITIPSTVTPGTSRMRVVAKMSDDAGHTLPTPCNSPADPLGYHGEIEDYTVVFTNGGSVGMNELAADRLTFSVEPNPFSGTSTLRYSVAESGVTQVTIYNLLGEKINTVMNEFQNAGEHALVIQSADLKNGQGVFFVEVKVNGVSHTEKIIVSD
jgi:hypothetical protein